MNTLSELAAPFSEAFDRLTNDESARVCLAVSGGPDSIALLLLANHVASHRIVAATVDHGLRAESAKEANFVSSLCEKLDVEHAVLRPDKPIIGNLQSAARTARYGLLEQFTDERECSWIATAHHQDDQVETFLMRLARGSGVDGLASVRAANGRIIRPLLQFTKEQLANVCADAGVTPIRDPSNDDDSFDRVRMRKWLAEKGLPIDGRSIGRSAAALSDASLALDWAVEQLIGKRIAHDGDAVIFDASNLPAELQRRLLCHAIGLIDPDLAPRGETLTRAMAAAKDGGKAMVGNILVSGGNGWRVELAPRRKSTG